MPPSDEELKKRAEEGSNEARTSLALLHELGLDRPVDDEKAAGFWGQAAKSGDGWAQASLSECFRTGRGVKKDMAMAHQLEMAAAKHGCLTRGAAAVGLMTHQQEDAFPKKVLVIDQDSEHVRRLFKPMNRNGYGVIVVPSPRAALERVVKEPAVGLVITEFFTDSIPMIKNLRKKLPAMGLIVHSEFDDQAVIGLLKNLEVHGILAKPVDTERLCSMVTRFWRVAA